MAPLPSDINSRVWHHYISWKDALISIIVYSTVSHRGVSFTVSGRGREEAYERSLLFAMRAIQTSRSAVTFKQYVQYARLHTTKRCASSLRSPRFSALSYITSEPRAN